MPTFEDLIADAIAEQEPAVAERLVAAIAAHGFSFEIEGDRLVFETAGERFLSVALELVPVAAPDGRWH